MNDRLRLEHVTARFLRCVGISSISLSALFACAITQPPTTDNISGPVAGNSTATAPANSVVQESVLPSSLVNYLHMQLYLQPDWSQDEVASALLPLARSEGLNDHERFFLAQLNFMAFEGDAAYDIYAEFTGRDDWYGWMARMRHTIIDARFYENFERLESSVNYERENFRFKPEYSTIPGFGERSLCAHWAEENEHQRAIELALSTLAQTPRDAPYATLTIIASCFPSFKEMGREDEAFDLTQTVVDDLSIALALRASIAGPYPAYDKTLYENIRDNQWYHRSTLAPIDYINQKFEKMIATLEQFLACRRDNRLEACP